MLRDGVGGIVGHVADGYAARGACGEVDVVVARGEHPHEFKVGTGGEQRPVHARFVDEQRVGRRGRARQPARREHVAIAYFAHGVEGGKIDIPRGEGAYVGAYYLHSVPREREYKFIRTDGRFTLENGAFALALEHEVVGDRPLHQPEAERAVYNVVDYHPEKMQAEYIVQQIFSARGGQHLFAAVLFVARGGRDLDVEFHAYMITPRSKKINIIFKFGLYKPTNG